MDSSDALREFDSQDPQEELIHLREINKQLKEELKKVKNEFSQTVNVIPNMENLYNENNKLKKSLFDAQSKNDDLQKRLNIALQTNSELTSSKENAKANVIKEYENQITDLHVELSALKADNENMKSSYQKQLKNSESNMYNIQSENSVMQSQISKLMKAAEIKFTRKFENIPDLIKFMNQPVMAKQKDQITEEENEQNALAQTIQNLKQKLQAQKQKVKTLQMGVIKMKKKTENENLKFEQEMTQLKDQLKQKDNEIQSLTLVNQQKLIVKPPPKMRNQFVQVKTIIEDTDSESLRHELASVNAQLNEKDTTISMLKLQLDADKNQINDLEISKTQIASRLKSISTENDTLQNEIFRHKKQNEKLSKELEVALTQLAEKAAESTLPKEMLEGENARLKLDQKNYEKTIDQLETMLKKQKDEIQDLSTTKEKLIVMIEKQSKIFSIMEEKIQSQKPPEPQKIEKIITVDPKFEWQFGNLPEEILDIVTEIGENDSLTIESRIKSIFMVVNKYIENQLNSRQKEKSSLESSNQELKKELDEYKKKIVAAFEIGEEATPETAPELISKYIVQSKRLANELQTLKNENDRLLHLTECEDYDTIIKNIVELKENSHDLSEQVKEEKKKRTAMRQQIQKVLAAKDKEVEQKTTTLKKMNDSSRKQISQLQSQIDKLQEQNKKLIEQLSYMPETAEQLFSDAGTEHVRPVHQEDDSTSQLQMSKEASQMSFQIEDLTGKLESSNKAIAKWKDVAKKSQEEVAQYQKKMADINQANDAQIERIHKEFDEEREQYNNAIRELNEKMQNEALAHKKALQNLTESLSQAHQRLDQTTQELNNQKFEVEKANLNASSLIETAERSKKLVEAQLKAQILSIESNHSMQIEEEKQKSEQAKRNLIEILVSNFREFTDISEKLDEDCFKEVVRKVKAQIEKNQKTENAIRKLVRAKDEESTDDALTQFIIRMHPQFQSQ